MALFCYVCGKATIRGNKVSHSGRRSKRTFKPNLHTFWLGEGSKRVKGRFCSKCIRAVKRSIAPVAASS